MANEVELPAFLALQRWQKFPPAKVGDVFFRDNYAMQI